MTLSLLVAAGQRGRAFGRRTLGGGASPLDAPSTTLYVPRSHPFDMGEAPDLPQEFVESHYIERSWIRNVVLTDTADSADNMTALNAEVVTAAAASGHTRIRLPAGMQLAGKIELLPHTAGDFWTYIEAEDMPTAEGLRCDPTSMTLVDAPTIIATGNNASAIGCRRGANNYRIAGIHCVPEPTSTGVVYFTVHIHAVEPTMEDEESQSQVAHCPRDIILDRMLITGPIGDTGEAGGPNNDTTAAGRNRNAIDLNGIRVGLVDSYITGAFNAFGESHGIVAFNTPGPIKVVGCFSDAGSVPFFVGGSTPAIGPLEGEGKPCDIEVRRNYFAHNEAWCPADGAGANKYNLKGLLELKNCHRVLVEANVFERCPDGAQTGMAVVIKSAGDGSSGAPEGLGTAHVSFRYNRLSNVRHGFNCDGFGDPLETPTVQCNHVAAYHNLWYDVGVVTANGDASGNSDVAAGTCFILGGPTNDLVVRFNTAVVNVLAQSAMMKVQNVANGSEAVGFEFADNVIVSPAWSGIVAYSAPEQPSSSNGDAIIDYATAPMWDRNLIVGTDDFYSSTAVPPGGPTHLPLNDNVYPDAGENPELIDVVDAAGFVDADAHDYRLAEGSPGKGISVDGADPGANIDDVELATTGVAP